MHNYGEKWWPILIESKNIPMDMNIDANTINGIILARIIYYLKNIYLLGKEYFLRELRKKQSILTIERNILDFSILILN